MKMTYEQVEKALGICSSEHLGCEDGCPYVEVPCLDGDALLKDALALVKTKDTELDILIRKNETLKDENFELKAEIERLKGHQKDGFFNLLGNCLVFSKTLEEYNDMRKGLKAEAVNEFAERLTDIFPMLDALHTAMGIVMKEMGVEDKRKCKK